MLISFKRIIKYGWSDIFRNLGLSLASIFIMIMVICLITMLFLLNPVSQALIKSVEQRVDISVYFRQDTLSEEVINIRSEIAEIPEVREVEYISKQEALEIFIENHKDDPVIIESLAEVGYNPFLDSLNIKAWDASQYEAVASFLEKGSFQNLIDKIDYHKRKPVIEKVAGLIQTINKIGLFFSVIFGIIALLIAFNTVRIAIHNSKEEIFTMRLVGASNWFARGPFLIQGIIIGFIAALITLLITFGLCYGFDARIRSLVPEISLLEIFFSNFFALFLIQLATGIGLGILSSFIAIRKYLKV